MTITQGKNFSYTSLRDKPTFILKVSTAQSILIWNEITKCVNTVAPCFQFKILLKQYLQDNDLKLGF